jgi:hypothetical protein
LRLPDGRELTLYETDFIEGLALQAAVALENARNHKRNIEFARVQQDMDAARAIQRSLLPQKLPSIPGYSLAFRSDTCYEVGGDYLDIVEQPDGSVLMAVADVAGKGLASAIMALASAPPSAPWPPPACRSTNWPTRMNQHHWAEGEEARRRYVTAIFLRSIPRRAKSRWSTPATIQVSSLSRAPRRTSSTPPERRWACCRACAT